MSSAPDRDNEAASLAALHRLQVLDSEPEEVFNAMARVASLACAAPVALVSLVDAGRQWFKARVGLPGLRETPREIAFCAHAVRGRELFEISDALSDARFADNPLVTGETGARFYAGAPIVLSDQSNIGTVCVIDRQVRTLDATQRGILTGLAAMAAHALEGRWALLQREEVAAEAARAALLLRHSADAIVGVSAQGLISHWNPAATTMFGYTAQEILGRPLALLVPPGACARLPLAAGDAVARTYETRWLRSGALPVSVSVTEVPEHDAGGRPVGASHFVRDITASETARHALEFSEDRLRRLYESAPALLHSIDPQGRLLSVSDAWLAWLGYQREEVLGRALTDFLAPASRALAQAAAIPAFFATGRAEKIEYQVIARNGDVLDVLASAILDLDAQGRPLRSLAVMEDITRRKRAERRLRDERRRLANIIEGTSAGSLEWNIETGETHINERWAQMLGYRLGELLPARSPAWTWLMHPEDQHRAKALLQRHLNGETAAYEYEARVRHKDGHWIWVLDRGKLFGQSGEASRKWMAGTRMEISERKLTEEKLAQAEAFSLSILDSVSTQIAVLDSAGTIVAVNAPWRGSVPPRPGLGAAYLQAGLPDAALAWGGDSVEARAGIQAVLDGRLSSFHHEYACQSRDQHRWFDMTVTPLGVAGRGAVVSYIDITERVESREEVQRSHALLRGSIDALDEAFALFDADDRLVLFNQRYRQLFPRCQELIVPGTQFADIVRTGAEREGYLDAVGRLDEWVTERLALHAQPSMQLTRRFGDGRVVRCVERRMPSGHVVALGVDITELARASDAAQAASLAKSQFLANMSHEIRTPVNAVLGMLALLLRTELSTKQSDYAAKAERAARLLARLLGDILDFSRIETGQLTLDPQAFRVDDLLQDLSAVLAPAAGDKHLALSFDIDPAMPSRLVGDALRLQQVLINLGGNAVKFTAEGEVVVSMSVVTRGAGQVTLDIAVRDTGIGIAAPTRECLFSAFTQAEASTTRRYGGTGLGLVISQRLVGLMGGRLCVDSEPGRGSRFHFRITLPVAQQAPQAEAPGPSPSGDDGGARRLQGLRLLVVEDNPNNQQVARELLEAEGAVVTIAENGQEAVDQVAAAAPAFDIVLMDLQMPVMDGLTATTVIRQTHDQRALPIVAMTANVMASDHESCVAAGMNAHVGKPFDLDDLVRVLRLHAGREPAPPWPRLPMAPPSGIPAGHARLAEAAGVDVAAALARLNGKRSLYLRVLGNFTRDLPGFCKELCAFQSQGRTADAARHLHTLKGLAATVGAMALSAEAGKGEKELLALVQDAGAGAALVRCLADQIGAAAPGLAALHQALLADEAKGSAPVRATAATLLARRCALQRLAGLLENSDMAAVQVMGDLAHEAGRETGGSLQQLEEAVTMLDFGRALVLCRELAEV